MSLAGTGRRQGAGEEGVVASVGPAAAVAIATAATAATTVAKAKAKAKVKRLAIGSCNKSGAWSLRGNIVPS